MIRSFFSIYFPFSNPSHGLLPLAVSNLWSLFNCCYISLIVLCSRIILEEVWKDDKNQRSRKFGVRLRLLKKSERPHAWSLIHIAVETRPETLTVMTPGDMLTQKRECSNVCDPTRFSTSCCDTEIKHKSRKSCLIFVELFIAENVHNNFQLQSCFVK